MDPFSITVGVVGLIGTSSKIITSLKGVADSSKGIDGRLRVLISEVEIFKAMLESTRATLDSDEIQHILQATGYLASHWANISACISDGKILLANFASKLAKIDKSVNFLDSARKALRLKSSWEDVMAFQSQLSSCRETISVSLQVVVLCTQVLSRGIGSSPEFCSEVMELVTTIHQTSQDVCSRMEALGQRLPTDKTQERMESLRNMKKCIRSSARIATTASSLSFTTENTNSVAEASEFHDFLTQPNPDTIAWITTTSKLDLVAIDHAPSLHSQPVTLLSAHDLSDSDDDIEREIATLHLKRGRQAFDGDDLSTAERLLLKGLDRLKASKSHKQHVEMYREGLSDLATLYRQQGKWRETKEIINERLSLLSRTATADSTEVLKEKLTLAEVLLQLDDLVEARLHARACIKAYHKLGLEGREDLERSLNMMIRICARQHDTDGEEEYQLVLSSLLMSEDASMVLNPPQDEVEVTAASGMRILPKVEITKPASLDIPNEYGAAETMTRKDSLSSCVSETELMPQRSSAIHLVAPYVDQSPSDLCSKTESIDERALAGGHEYHTGWYWPFLGEYDEADEAETALESTCRESEENVGRVLPIGLSDYLDSKKLDHTGGKGQGCVDKFLPPHQVSISNPELGVRDRASLIQERTGEFSRHESDRSSLKTATFDDTTEVPVSSSSSHKNTAAECDQTVMVIDQDPGVTRPDIPVPLLPRIRALFVGGTCSGKTSLISRYIYGSETLANANDFTRVLTPHYKACLVQLDSGTTSFELVLWDSPGPINDRLLPDIVQNISEAIGCIVLCFAVDEPELVSDIDTVVSSLPDTS